jgi:hypothetical protein
MAIDGNWTMRIETDDIDPEVVPREATFTITTRGDELTGTMEGPYPMGEGVVIAEAAIDGDQIRWMAQMRGERLRPQVLEFTGTLGDGEMKGEVEVGIFGTATFEAKRA